MGYAFAGVEKLLRGGGFPGLFLGKYKSLTPLVGTLNTIPVKKSGLGLQNPVTSTDKKFQSSRRASTELIHTVTEESELSTAGQLQALRE